MIVKRSLLLLLLVTAVLHADTLYFSYQRLSGPILSGALGGTLQPDNNSFFVTSISSLEYAGAPAAALGYVDSVDAYTGFVGSAPAVVTLDGSFFDFLACDTSACGGSGFVFAKGNAFAAFIGYPDYNASPDLGDQNGTVLEPFNSEGWTTLLAPEPGALELLLVSAVFLLAYFGLKRRMKVL